MNHKDVKFCKYTNNYTLNGMEFLKAKMAQHSGEVPCKILWKKRTNIFSSNRNRRLFWKAAETMKDNNVMKIEKQEWDMMWDLDNLMWCHFDQIYPVICFTEDTVWWKK